MIHYGLLRLSRKGGGDNELLYAGKETLDRTPTRHLATPGRSRFCVVNLRNGRLHVRRDSRPGPDDFRHNLLVPDAIRGFHNQRSSQRFPPPHTQRFPSGTGTECSRFATWMKAGFNQTAATRVQGQSESRISPGGVVTGTGDTEVESNSPQEHLRNLLSSHDAASCGARPSASVLQIFAIAGYYVQFAP